MEMLGFASVAAITIICYLAALFIRATQLNKKWLPSICGVLGGALGIAALYLMPDFLADDLLSAAAIGIVSGLAATGAHQIAKQLRK